MRWPFQNMSPACLGSKPSIVRNNVVFPEPMRPVMTVHEPRWSWR